MHNTILVILAPLGSFHHLLPPSNEWLHPQPPRLLPEALEVHDSNHYHPPLDPQPLHSTTVLMHLLIMNLHLALQLVDYRLFQSGQGRNIDRHHYFDCFPFLNTTGLSRS